MSETLQIRTYKRGDHSALCTFMGELQDLEREWSNDRAPGPEMAADHIDYLLDLAQQSEGQAFVAKLDDQLVGFLILTIESSDEGDVHLIEPYRQYGVVTDLYVAEEARHQGLADISSTPLRARSPSRAESSFDHDIGAKPSRSRGLCTTRLRVLYSHDV